MDRFTLSDSEVVRTLGLLAEVAERFDSAEAPGFLHEAPVYAQELPHRLRRFLNDFRLLEPRAGVHGRKSFKARYDGRDCGSGR